MKHIPQRTCIGCRQVNAKREFVRVVRTAEGHVEIDPTGKKAGRGAYLHRDRECWQHALETRAIERALKLDHSLGVTDRAMLSDYAQGLATRSEAPASA